MPAIVIASGIALLMSVARRVIDATDNFHVRYTIFL